MGPERWAPRGTNPRLCSDVSESLEGETFDGTDENGNGLIDEPGFCVEREGELITLRLTLEIAGPQGMRVLRTVQRRLTLRVSQ